MNSRRLTDFIKAEARRLGFFACGTAQATEVDSLTADIMRRWLANGGQADMSYMANHLEKRLDPRLLMEGVKSIVCLALNYAPSRHISDDGYQFAAYAYGQDYHDVMKAKLRQLAGAVAGYPDADRVACRVFCDTAPVLERYWAVRAGLGWIGRNHQLIIPYAGSMFFLGELFLDIELCYDSPMPNRCGHCHACVDACPTKAIRTADDGFHSERCLSYLTIENRGDIPLEAAHAMHDTIYGCDRCQQACPWNRLAKPTTEPLLQPKEELLNMKRADWQALTVEDYRRIFKGSAVKRAKYEGLMRNIKAATANEKGKVQRNF